MMSPVPNRNKGKYMYTNRYFHDWWQILQSFPLFGSRQPINYRPENYSSKYQFTYNSWHLLHFMISLAGTPSFDTRHAKKALRSMAAPILILVWHQLFRIWLCWHHRLHSQKVGVILKLNHATKGSVLRTRKWTLRGAVFAPLFFLSVGMATLAHPSFGMTTTKTVLLWRVSVMTICYYSIPGKWVFNQLVNHWWTSKNNK